MFLPRLESFSAFSWQRLLCFVILPSFALPGCPELCSAGGEERRKSRMGHGGAGEGSQNCGLQLLPGVLPESDKNSDFHLPCVSARASSSCSVSLLCPGWEEPCSSQSHRHPCLGHRRVPSLLPGRQLQAELGFGSPSQVCTGGRFLCI